MESSPQPNDADLIENDSYRHVVNLIIGNNAIALKAAEATARTFDLETLLITRSASGDVSKVSYAYVKLVKLICLENNGDRQREQELEILNSILDVTASDLLKIVEKASRNLKNGQGLILLGGGEPTVNVKGHGKGGRNQELALRFSVDWLTEILKESKLAHYYVLFLSAGTDGQDGPTEAAGAVSRPAIKHILQKFYEKVKEQMKLVQVAEELEKYRSRLEQIELMMPENVLERNDSYSFFSRFENGDNHLVTGLTGTNVMDLHFIYIKRRETERNRHINFKEEPQEGTLKFI